MVEINYGGDLVIDNLKVKRPTILPHIVKVRATTGKDLRADPIVALYEQGLIHHCSAFKALELQMTTWLPTDKDSPDRIDALVWVFYKLFLEKLTFYIVNRDGVMCV